MEITQALQVTAKAEGWLPVDIASICRVSESQAVRWLDGTSNPKGNAVVILLRKSKTFRDLILGDSPEQKAA